MEALHELDKIKSKMPYCKENYHKSPLVHSTIIHLWNGADPLIIIDELIKEVERISEEYRELLLK